VNDTDTLKRFPDWEDRLRTYFDTCGEIAFAYGEHDCSLFAASAVQRQTGVDFAADFRGRYSDAKGAAQALRQYGAGTLQKTVTAALGKAKHVARAKRGDVVLLNNSLGICAGKFSLFVGQLDAFGQHLAPDDITKARGLIPHPTALCRRAWTVPF
jgi:hypothetical protein